MYDYRMYQLHTELRGLIQEYGLVRILQALIDIEPIIVKRELRVLPTAIVRAQMASAFD